MFSHRTQWNLAPNRFTEAQMEARESGARILDLTISNPTQAGFTFDHATILGALNRAESLQYDPEPEGLLSH